jgi:hypothetical protein
MPENIEMENEKDKELVGCFISIPKCATKTILRMFALGRNRDNHYKEESNQHVIYENHQRLKILEERFDLDKKFVFTFVRNPYDRIKSWYNYHITTEPYKSQTLNEWIQNGCPTHWKVQNQTNWRKENLSPLLQFNFVDGKTKVDFIGKIENFEEDCKLIITKLNKLFEDNGLEKRISYKTLQANRSTDQTKEQITDENKELIYTMFRQDFEYFGYEK